MNHNYETRLPDQLEVFYTIKPQDLPTAFLITHNNIQRDNFRLFYLYHISWCKHVYSSHFNPVGFEACGIFVYCILF